LVKQFAPGNWRWVVALLLIGLDPMTHASSHGGRMDTLVMALMIASIHYYLLFDERRDWKALLVSGIFAGIAVLTTPRIGFILIPMSLVLAWREVIQGVGTMIKNALIWGAPILLLLVFWIYSSHGSIGNMLEFYGRLAHLNVSGGASFYVPVYQWPLIVAGLLFAFDGIRRIKLAYLKPLNLIAIGSIAFYYWIVKDNGPYSMLVVPFFIVLVVSSDILHIANRYHWSRIVVIALIMFNLGIFGFKSVYVLANMESRDPAYLAQQIEAVIPPGSKVVGDELYYFGLLSTGSDYQYIHLIKTAAQREKYQREVWDYDFIIWSDRLAREEPELMIPYRANSELVEVSRIQAKTGWDIAGLLSRFGLKTSESYKGVVFKRRK
jgi:apolipoprotein N-acyltransferase